MANVILREEENPIFTNLSKNIGMLSQAKLAQTLAEKKRQQDLEDYKKKLLIKQQIEGKTDQQGPKYKITPKDIEEVGSTISGEVEQETPYLKGLPGILERFMPFGGKARKRGMQRETERRMEPVLEAQKQQIIGKPFAGMPTMQAQETDIESLIEEYQTTTDPARLQELEDLLAQAGVSFE